MTDSWEDKRDRLDGIVERAETRLKAATADLQLSATEVDFTDVVFGLLARQYQLWTVLVLGPSAWTSPTSPLLLRALTDGLITISWLERNRTMASLYKTYSAGRLKLLAAHWRAMQEPDSEPLLEEYADQLEEFASTEVWSAVLPVDLSNWNGKSIREMAEEAGLKRIYDLSYSPLSAEAHGEWMALRSRYLRRCDEKIHKEHWLPSFERLTADEKIPSLGTRYFLVSVEASFKALGLEYDEAYWSALQQDVDMACGFEMPGDVNPGAGDGI